MTTHTKSIEAEHVYLLIREIAAINRCKGYDGIVKLVDIKHKDNNYLITTKWAGHHLGYYIYDLNESHILKYITQLLQTVAYCHSVNIYHRDIKPDNIVLEDNRITLIDFDRARHDVDNMIDGELVITGIAGTAEYACPESLSDSTTFYHKGDEWSIGVVLYNMITRQHLIEGMCPLREIQYKINNGLGLENYTKSTTLITLCKGLLTIDPAKRLSCEDALKMLGASMPEGKYIIVNDILPYPHSNIRAAHYRILDEWITEVVEKFELCSASLLNAERLIQLYTSYNIINVKDYQLLGMVCLHLSSCLFDTHHPYIEDFIFVSDNSYTEEQFHNLLNVILAYFNYNVDRL